MLAKYALNIARLRYGDIGFVAQGRFAMLQKMIDRFFDTDWRILWLPDDL